MWLRNQPLSTTKSMPTFRVILVKLFHLVIYVTDEGFSEKILKARSPLLYTTDTTGEHLGMGFIISRVLCQKLNGELKLSNHAGGGASVKITLIV